MKDPNRNSRTALAATLLAAAAAVTLPWLLLPHLDPLTRPVAWLAWLLLLIPATDLLADLAAAASRAITAAVRRRHRQPYAPDLQGENERCPP